MKMLMANILSILLLAQLSLFGLLEAKCGIPELMKYVTATQKMASHICKNSGNHPDKELLEKGKKCLKAEISKAHSDYKKTMEELVQKCISDDVLEDPCNKVKIDKVMKCAGQFVKDRPILKSDAMKWIGTHCQKFVNHIKSAFECVGHPLKV